MKRKSGITRQLRAAVAAALLGGIFSLSPAALALPVGGMSVGGTATISESNGNMTIAGTASGNLLTWVDFSIASGERVDFTGEHTYLNYVTGHAASDILGTLAGQGTIIYLVNPNGINIGDGALIDVGTLHLSTADLTGHLDSFDNALSAVNGATSFAGDVVNKGTLKAAQSITVEGNNITFKNVADVTAENVALKSVGGEIHLGSADGIGDYTNTTGTKYLYKLVGNKEELTSIKDGLSGNYMLNNDIEVGEISPLGDFTGKFDGLNYALQNISINSNAANVGLFSKNSGTIENLVLSGGSVTGSITGREYGYMQNQSQSVGALAGQNTGIIRHVSNGNSVTGNISGQMYIGSYGGTATQYVGGLVGENAAGGEILASSNTGSVTGSIKANYQNKHGRIGYDGGAVLQDVGGLAGKNAGSLAESYNIATVSGEMSSVKEMGFNATVNEYVGGLVGENTGSIVNAYQGDSAVTGSLSAAGTFQSTAITEAVGGITGNNSGNIEAVYSQVTAGGSTSGGHAERVAVSFKPLVGTGTEAVNSYTENLTTAATFGAWGDNLTADGSNKNAVWRIYEGKTAPLLTAFMKCKDNYLGSKVYDGTAEVGNSEVPSTNTSNQQVGINWVKDITVITPKSLTVSGEVKKVYDGNTEASLGISNLEGVVEGDAASLSLTATASYDTKNAGTGKTVTYSNLALSGDKAKNYALDKSGSLKTGIITTRDITATVANQSKTYDGQTAVENVEATLGNIVAGDDVSATASGNFVDDSVGENKDITYDSFTLRGTDKDNYNLTTARYIGKGTINAAPTPDPTPDPTPTPTPTPTPAPTPTPSQTSTSTSTATSTPAATSETAPSSTGAGGETAAQAAASQSGTASASTVAAAVQVVDRQLEERGVDTRQLKAATNSASPNVQVSAVATVSPAAAASPVASGTTGAVASSTETGEGSAQSAATSATTARADLNLSWGTDGLLTLENKGVNAPVSMQVESLAAPAGNNAAAVTATPAAETQTVAQNSSQTGGSGSAAVTVAPAAGEQTVTQNSSQTGGSGSASAAVAPAAGGQTVAQNSSQTGSNSAAGTKTVARDSGQSAGSRENAQGQESTQSDSADTTEENGENRDNEERE